MSGDRNKGVALVEINAQSRADAKESTLRWGDEPSIRMYGYSPGHTALQIRGALKTPSAPPAYAHALLDDAQLLWLYAAVKERIKERGLRVKDAPDLDDDQDAEVSL